MDNFCVYIFLDTRKPGEYIYGDYIFSHQPIYVGKGVITRPKRHFHIYKKTNLRFHNKIKSIIEKGFKPIYNIISDGLNEKDAFNLEKNLISLIGRVENGGILLNLSDGGEGQSGYVHTNITKEKIKNSIKNNKKWQEYVKSKDFSRKVSDGLMGHIGYGKGIPRTDDVKKKISDNTKGDKNHMFGKNHSELSRNKMSQKRKGELNPNAKKYEILNLITNDIIIIKGYREVLNYYNLTFNKDKKEATYFIKNLIAGKIPELKLLSITKLAEVK